MNIIDTFVDVRSQGDDSLNTLVLVLDERLTTDDFIHLRSTRDPKFLYAERKDGFAHYLSENHENPGFGGASWHINVNGEQHLFRGWTSRAGVINTHTEFGPIADIRTCLNEPINGTTLALTGEKYEQICQANGIAWRYATRNDDEFTYRIYGESAKYRCFTMARYRNREHHGHDNSRFRFDCPCHRQLNK